MSKEQKDAIIKYLDVGIRWMNGALLAFLIWFLNDHYNSVKQMQTDIQDIKEEVSTLKTTVQFLKEYEIIKR